MKPKLLQWKCPTCGKIIDSLWEKQLEFNKQSHLASHDVNNEVEE